MSMKNFSDNIGARTSHSD